MTVARKTVCPFLADQDRARWRCSIKAAIDLQDGREVDWDELVRWDQLPKIRDGLDRLPHPQQPRTDESEQLLQNIFRWDGNNWIIAFETKPIPKPDGPGLFYIHLLLEKPEVHFTASKMRCTYATWRSSPDSSLRSRTEQVTLDELDDQKEESVDSLGEQLGDLGDDMDQEGEKRVRQRLEELKEQLKSSRKAHDSYQIEHYQNERKLLIAALRGAHGPGGRRKKLSPVARKDRNQVRMAIKRALINLTKTNLKLSEHLQHFLRNGPDFVYTGTQYSWDL